LEKFDRQRGRPQRGVRQVDPFFAPEALSFVTRICYFDDETVGEAFLHDPARGGYIMMTSPIAIGIDVVPTLMRDRLSDAEGKSQPMTTPAPMAMKIHSVRYRSRKES
jgi:hypothetical protein